MKIAAEGVLRQWPDAVYLHMDYSDQEYGALVPLAVLHADGQEFDDDMELWDDLDNGADLSSLVANLSDLDDVWSDYRTHYNDADRSSGSNPCLDLKPAASITQERISSAIGARNVYAQVADPAAAAAAPEPPADDTVQLTAAGGMAHPS